MTDQCIMTDEEFIKLMLELGPQEYEEAPEPEEKEK